ncbi:hypothetical protein [Aliarcobacter butzleri]|uniref:hypothetical protein n=1 Tax=Aliarcobacter butzleri TaxID=28197 RepID=UPI0021B482C5|nr:hypothetical protein [Aliarcobacter butzleri]MCT7632147.1 hypothetical protein [Aliarcobacter butzleri]
MSSTTSEQVFDISKEASKSRQIEEYLSKGMSQEMDVEQAGADLKDMQQSK